MSKPEKRLLPSGFNTHERRTQPCGCVHHRMYYDGSLGPVGEERNWTTEECTQHKRERLQHEIQSMERAIQSLRDQLCSLHKQLSALDEYVDTA